MAQASFRDSLRLGQEGERILDDFFSRWYTIQFASAAQESTGIDRIFTPRFAKDKTEKTVEYKTDFSAHKTGNAYLETLSRSDKGISGWLHTSVAEYILYFAYPKLVFVFELPKLREFVFSRSFPERSTANRGYFGSGLIVSLRDLTPIAYTILEVSSGTK